MKCMQSCCSISKYGYSHWNFVAISHTSWATRYYISISGSRPLSLISHSLQSRPVLTFVPLCCLMQQTCGFRWNFTYVPSAMSGLSVSGVTSAILNSNRIAHWAMLLSAAVTSASSKTNAATLNLPPKVIYALWFNGHQLVSHFHQQIIEPMHLHFRWCNSIMGWTISRLDGSRNATKRNGKFRRIGLQLA